MEVGNRTGDIIIEIAPPARFKNANSMHISKGGHGYMNTLPDMGATFVAVGPAFKTNTTLPVFSNLEVYPALAKILGIAPVTQIDGKLDAGKGAYSLTFPLSHTLLSLPAKRRAMLSLWRRMISSESIATGTVYKGLIKNVNNGARDTAISAPNDE